MIDANLTLASVNAVSCPGATERLFCCREILPGLEIREARDCVPLSLLLPSVNL